jgi:hypothetical protein
MEFINGKERQVLELTPELIEKILAKSIDLSGKGIPYSTFCRIGDENWWEKLSSVVKYGLVGSEKRLLHKGDLLPSDLLSDRSKFRTVWFNITGQRAPAEAFRDSEMVESRKFEKGRLLGRGVAHFIGESFKYANLGDNLIRLANLIGLVNLKKAKEISEMSTEEQDTYKQAVKKYLKTSEPPKRLKQAELAALSIEDKAGYLQRIKEIKTGSYEPLDDQTITLLNEIFVIPPHEAFYANGSSAFNKKSFKKIDDLDGNDILLKETEYDFSPNPFAVATNEIGTCYWPREFNRGSNFSERNTISLIFNPEHLTHISIDEAVQLSGVGTESDIADFNTENAKIVDLYNKYWADPFHFSPDWIDKSKPQDVVDPAIGYMLARRVPTTKISGWVVTISNTNTNGIGAMGYLDFLPENPLKQQIEDTVQEIAKLQLQLYAKHPSRISPIYNGITGEILWPKKVN